MHNRGSISESLSSSRLKSPLKSLFKYFVSDVLQSWIKMVVVEYVWKFLT